MTRPPGLPPTVTVREATAEDLTAVLSVLDAAALATDADPTRQSIERGQTLVAVDDGTVVGALVLDGDEILSVAVRRRRRGQGIGTALVRTAADRRGCLVAEFRTGVRPFYGTLGFDVEPLPEPGRYRGTLSGNGNGDE